MILAKTRHATYTYYPESNLVVCTSGGVVLEAREATSPAQAWDAAGLNCLYPAEQALACILPHMLNDATLERVLQQLDVVLDWAVDDPKRIAFADAMSGLAVIAHLHLGSPDGQVLENLAAALRADNIESFTFDYATYIETL